jgi:hypothetical protein
MTLPIKTNTSVLKFLIFIITSITPRHCLRFWLPVVVGCTWYNFLRVTEDQWFLLVTQFADCHDIYRIMAVLKFETDIITASLTWRGVILVIMNIKNFKTDVFVLIGNANCVTKRNHWSSVTLKKLYQVHPTTTGSQNLRLGSYRHLLHW